MTDIYSAPGTENNPVNIGQENILHGNPAIKLEKPHTIVGFPGGDVEIARTVSGDYWVHVAIREGAFVSARLDAAGRYADDANETLKTEIGKGDVQHIAFLVSPPKKA